MADADTSTGGPVSVFHDHPLDSGISDDAGVPGRGSSLRPSNRRNTNRPRHFPTVGHDTPNWPRHFAVGQTIRPRRHDPAIESPVPARSCPDESTPATFVARPRSTLTTPASDHGWTILPRVGITADVEAGRFSAAPLREPEMRRSVVLGISRAGCVLAATEVVAAELVRRVCAVVRSGRWPLARPAARWQPCNDDHCSG